ncbi:DUF3426 domain-containing protein [Xanthomonas campestris]|uniref:DUF3426 domain-containing protein n=1 Tax=Xanthomonas campestris TaxID=339 RepID=UPI00388FDEB1
MSETPPPRRPLATFLRAAPAAPPLVPTPPAPSTEPADTAVPAPESAPVAAPLAAPVPAPVRPLPAPPRSPEAAPPDAAARAPDTLIAPTRRDAPLSASPLPLPATPPAPVPVPHSSAQTADAAMRRSADDDGRAAAAAIAAVAAATSTAPLAPAAATHATNVRDQPAIAAQPAASAPGATVTQTPQASPPANQDGQPAQAARQAAPAPEAEAGASAEAELEADPDVTATTSTSTSASASPSPTPAPTLEPAFARRSLARPRLRASGWQWAVLVGLVLLLGLQIVLADRARLAGDARWRPLVSAACAVARCALPPWRDPATLTLLTRDVRPLPAYPGVLQIQASFRNDARWAQAWPWLQLSLSDADGRVIGTRVFSPQDYLGQAPATQDTLAPGQAVQVAFRVREPAASTAAFSFDFR